MKMLSLKSRKNRKLITNISVFLILVAYTAFTYADQQTQQAPTIAVTNNNSATNAQNSTKVTATLPAATLNLFTVKECLQSDFNIRIMHDTFAFGLFQNVLNIGKKHCILKINHEKYKFIKSGWIIDVCRGPIHIKKDLNGLKVIKKDSYCFMSEQNENSQSDKNLSDYCFEYSKIRTILQDDGLIFADGDRETLSSEHGKIYCASLLVKKYLQDALIFSLHNEYENNVNLLTNNNSSEMQPTNAINTTILPTSLTNVQAQTNPSTITTSSCSDPKATANSSTSFCKPNTNTEIKNNKTEETTTAPADTTNNTDTNTNQNQQEQSKDKEHKKDKSIWDIFFGSD
ncbi:MAG: hypothetical protein HQK51_00475 [Oligoflexia bacterium]|nr:hypothetical protein [Oligoflexia bacterium]